MTFGRVVTQGRGHGLILVLRAPNGLQHWCPAGVALMPGLWSGGLWLLMEGRGQRGLCLGLRDVPGSPHSWGLSLLLARGLSHGPWGPVPSPVLVLLWHGQGCCPLDKVSCHQALGLFCLSSMTLMVPMQLPLPGVWGDRARVTACPGPCVHPNPALCPRGALERVTPQPGGGWWWPRCVCGTDRRSQPWAELESSPGRVHRTLLHVPRTCFGGLAVGG